RTMTSNLRLLADLHHSRAARIRVAGGGAGGDAPDAQASALGLPSGQPQPPKRLSPSWDTTNHGGVQREVCHKDRHSTQTALVQVSSPILNGEVTCKVHPIVEDPPDLRASIRGSFRCPVQPAEIGGTRSSVICCQNCSWRAWPPAGRACR